MTFPDPRVTDPGVPEVEQEPVHDHVFGISCRPECPRWMNPTPQPGWETPQDWFFTFGANHSHPTTGERLGNAYVVIHGTCDSTRAAMLDLFGNRWSQQYMTATKAGVKRFRLRLVDLPKPDLPPFEAEVAVHAARLADERPVKEPVTPAEERTGVSDVTAAVAAEIASLRAYVAAGSPFADPVVLRRLDRIALWLRGGAS